MFLFLYAISNYFGLSVSLFTNTMRHRYRKVTFSCEEQYEDPIGKTILKLVSVGTEEFTFPSIVTSTSDGADNSGVFYQCSETLKKVTFPTDSKLKRIGSYSFYGCNILKEISIPSSLEAIGRNAFYLCKSLTILTFPSESKLTLIDTMAFSSCQLSEFVLPKSIKILGNNAFSGNQNLKEVIIPSGLNDLGGWLFQYCANLKTVIFEEPCFVTYIKPNTFEGTKIEVMNIPSSVSTFGDQVFRGNSVLREFVVHPSNQNFKAVDGGVLYSKNGLKLIVFPTAKTVVDSIYEISETTEGISSIGFNDCKNIRKIVIKNGDRMTIDGGAFAGCTNLETFEVRYQNSGITSKSLKFEGSALILNDVSMICVPPKCGIKSFTLPNSIRVISMSCFQDVNTLEEIVVLSKTDSKLITIENSAFKNCKNFRGFNLIPNSLKEIIGEAFSSCVSMSSFPIENSNIEKIGGIVFNNCLSLTKLVFPPSIMEIGWYSFSNCMNIRSVDLSNCPKLNQLESYTFSNCISLEEVNIDNKVSLIHTNCFGNCVNLTKVTLPKNTLKELVGSVFSRCTKLSNLELPFDSLTNVGGRCFEFCESIEKIIINGVNTKIGDRAFDGCINLKVVELGPFVKEIQTTAFYVCSNLERFLVSESSTYYISIDGVLYTREHIDYTRNYINSNTQIDTNNNEENGLLKSNLNEVIQKRDLVAYPPGNKTGYFAIPSFVVDIYELSFYGSQHLRHLIIPNTVESIKYNAFDHCDSLGCGSVEYESKYYDALILAKMKAESLVPCPTGVFTSGEFVGRKINNKLWSLFFLFFIN